MTQHPALNILQIFVEAFASESDKLFGAKFMNERHTVQLKLAANHVGADFRAWQRACEVYAIRTLVHANTSKVAYAGLGFTFSQTLDTRS